MQASYNYTLYEGGLYNNPNGVPMTAFNIWYTGAGTTVTMQSSGGNTGAITDLHLIVDGVTVSSYSGTATLDANTTLTQVVAWIAGVSGFNATLLATTPATSRSAQAQPWGGGPGANILANGGGYGNAVNANNTIPFVISAQRGFADHHVHRGRRSL